MVDMFKKSKFFLCVAQKMNYEDGITFTENNIVSYLAELEEYISSLITYTAFKREDANAPISSIPLEKLNTKEFSKKTMFLEPPIDYTIINKESNIEGTAVEEGLQGEIITGKDLYQNFNRLVQTDSIKFNYKNDNNRNNQAQFQKDDDEQSL